METPPTVDDFRDRDFAGTFLMWSDGSIEILLEDALCYLGETPWEGCSDCWSRAVVAMAMHLGVLGAQGAQPGPMTSASAGGISASWGYSAQQSGLKATNWGRQVEALAAGCGRLGPFVLASDQTCC